jgi:hypothetical protein
VTIQNISLADVTQVIVAIVAVAGLILSIYNFYFNRRDKSPRLRANLVNEPIPRGPNPDELMLMLKVTNIGEKTVKIAEANIVWKKRRMAYLRPSDWNLKPPLDLQPGEEMIFQTWARQVAKALEQEGCTGRVSIRACLTTTVGVEFMSNKIAVGIKEML